MNISRWTGLQWRFILKEAPPSLAIRLEVLRIEAHSEGECLVYTSSIRIVSFNKTPNLSSRVNALLKVFFLSFSGIWGRNFSFSLCLLHQQCA